MSQDLEAQEPLETIEEFHHCGGKLVSRFWPEPDEPLAWMESHCDKCGYSDRGTTEYYNHENKPMLTSNMLS